MIHVSTLICSMAIRLLYQTVYQKRASERKLEKALLRLLHVVTGVTFSDEKVEGNQIRIAIIGAGSVGVSLAEELMQNPRATYKPVCFVDVDTQKAGRIVTGIPVLDPSEGKRLGELKVQEVVFAISNATAERKNEIFEIYDKLGYKIKTYDYPVLGSNEGGKRSIHDFDIEDLLFRSANRFLTEETMAWYRGKNVLITGGGGSIGSELARQIASCGPKRLGILDVYEDGAYDVQQELWIK
jgi:FlaA1/EpsC-like NDP-sugar epimerase